jgi:hypothetical protein
MRKKGRTEDRELLDQAVLSPCLVCGRVPSDPHHVTTVKAGGADSLDNVMSLCRMHHTEWHKSSPGTFCAKYPMAYNWLVYHGRTDIIRRFHHYGRNT